MYDVSFFLFSDSWKFSSDDTFLNALSDECFRAILRSALSFRLSELQSQRKTRILPRRLGLGRIPDNFAENCLLQGDPHLWFFKISKSGKTPKTPVCLGGADRFFQISKNQGSLPLKLSTVEKNDSRYRRQGHEREKEREISLFTLTFSLRAVRSCRDRDFPLPNYGQQMPRSEQYSFLQELGNTPPIWPVVSAERRKPESHCHPNRPHG